MANIKFDWEIIMRDCAEIIANDIYESQNKECKKEITTLPKLHNYLKEKYKIESKIYPNAETFRQVMHKKMNIPFNKKNVQKELYELAGKYNFVTEDVMVNTLKVDNCISSEKAEWLFVSISKIKEPPKKVNNSRTVDFFQLTVELKNKFNKDIVFITFDLNTLIVLCRNSKAKDKINRYLKRTLKSLKDFRKKVKDNGQDC